MRQAVFLEAADLAALRRGLPLRLQVGDVELLVLMNHQQHRVNGAQRAAAPPRRKFTDATRKRLLAQYEKVESKTDFLKRHHLSTSSIWAWRQRQKAGK